MYKMLLFLKHTDDESVTLHFTNSTLPALGRLLNRELIASDIDGGKLTKEGFIKFCEASFASKEEMGRLMQSPAGKEFNKDLSGYHNFLSVFFTDVRESV